MTEDEWLSCSTPGAIRWFLDGLGASERKLLLFTVACCDRLRHLLADGRSRTALDTIARFAAGRATPNEMETASAAAESAANAAVMTVWVSELGPGTAARAARSGRRLDAAVGPARAREVEAAVAADAGCNAHKAVAGAARTVWASRLNAVPTTYHRAWAAYRAQSARGEQAELAAQWALLLDLFGGPPGRAGIAVEWRTTTVVSLAKGMYESGDFSSMPILADALQDAGCDNEDVLSHCRCPGPHVRGCWVVDLILGKE